MKQNFSYLLIGNGRLASHLRFYLQSQNIRVINWNRKDHTQKDLEAASKNVNAVLLAIKDSVIDLFLEEYPFLKEKICVHFSGALVLENIVGLHPLMTFADQLYSIDFYKKIPFIAEKGHLSFNEVFPALENPSYALDPELKPLYHSLCVMGGNFTTLLWSKVFKSFEDQLGLPHTVLLPYLDKISENLKNNFNTALTGPLARKDISTIQANLKALKDDNYLEVYKSFVQATLPEIKL